MFSRMSLASSTWKYAVGISTLMLGLYSTNAIAQIGDASQNLPLPQTESVTPEGYDLLSPYGPFVRNETHSFTGRDGDESYLPFSWSIRGPTLAAPQYTDWQYDYQHSLMVSSQSKYRLPYANQVVQVFGGSSELETTNGQSYTDLLKRGAHATRDSAGSNLTYYSASGTKVAFAGGVYDASESKWHPNTVEFPNGAKWHFTYEALRDAGALGGVGPIFGRRVSRAINSYGYGFRISYLNPDPSKNSPAFPGDGGENNIEKRAVLKVESIFTNCVGTGTGCLDKEFREVSYGYTNNNTNFKLRFNSMKEGADLVQSYAEDTATGTLTVTRPGTATPIFEASLFSPTTQISGPLGVMQFGTINGENYYQGSTLLYRRTIERKDALNKTTTYLVDETPNYAYPHRSIVKEVTNDSGNKTIYEHDAYQRVTKVTAPEGNYIAITYDDRGNVAQLRTVAKPGSGLADLVESAIFPASCNSSNYRICNKPTSRTDAKGSQTDYVWSNAHGQLVSETMPADSQGVRPQTTYQYSAKTGLSGTQVWLVSKKTEKINASDVVVTDYIYNGVNKGLSLREMKVTSQSTVLRTCYGYDQYGRKVSETQPEGTGGSCP